MRTARGGGLLIEDEFPVLLLRLSCARMVVVDGFRLEKLLRVRCDMQEVPVQTNETDVCFHRGVNPTQGKREVM